MGTAKPWFRIILTNVVSKQQWIDYVEIFCCIYTLLLQYKTKIRSKQNKSCRRTASSPAGYILYCNIFIIKPYNIGHTDLDVFVCKSFCHLDIIIQV